MTFYVSESGPNAEEAFPDGDTGPPGTREPWGHQEAPGRRPRPGCESGGSGYVSQRHRVHIPPRRHQPLLRIGGLAGGGFMALGIRAGRPSGSRPSPVPQPCPGRNRDCFPAGMEPSSLALEAIKVP